MVASQIFQYTMFDLYFTTCVAILAYSDSQSYPVTNVYLCIFIYYTT
jgi:hypothetical protein